MNREQAINYLFSRGFTNEQVGEVVRALTYEPTTKNDKIDCEYIDCKNCVNHKYCDYEPTTKNDLGVDKFDKAINQSDLEEWIMETFPDWCVGDVRLIMNHMDEMPSVTPQLSVPEVTALAEWTEKLTKASEDAYNKGYADGVKSVNICPHCGEYIGEEE